MAMRKLFYYYLVKPILPFVFHRKFCSTITEIDNFTMALAENTAYIKQGKDKFTLSVIVKYSKLNFRQGVVIVRPIDEKLGSSLVKLNKKVTLQLEKFAKKKLRKTQEILEIPEVKTILFSGETPLEEDMPCSNIFDINDQLKLSILDVFYNVIVNSPWVDNFSLPSTILPQIEIFPVIFETSYVDMKLSTLTWYRTKMVTHTPPSKSTQWDAVGDGFYYLVKKEDAGHYLKLVFKARNEKLEGPEFTAVTLKPVLTAEQDYYFHKNHELTSSVTDDNTIRIVDYNVLADLYANTKEGKTWFGYCPQYALHLDVRAPALCTEIKGYNADIVCLQEVQSSAYQKYFQSEFIKKNLKGDLVVKQNAAEGLACFYNSNKFFWLDSSFHYYGSEMMQNPALADILSWVAKNEALLEKLKSLPHCVQFVAISPFARQKEVIVIANIHLTSLCFEGIKIMQIGMTIALLEQFINKLKSKVPTKNFSVIFCGDFNSTPASEVYEFMNQGFLSPDHSIWKNLFPNAENVINLTHPFNLKSSYGTPQYTNYTRDFKGCLDYVFYDVNSFNVAQIVPLPEEKELEENIGIPSVKFPSDHLPLVVDLQWAK